MGKINYDFEGIYDILENYDTEENRTHLKNVLNYIYGNRKSYPVNDTEMDYIAKLYYAAPEQVNCEHEIKEQEIQYGHCICGAPAHIVVQTCACGAGIGNRMYFCSNPDCPNFQKTENIIKKDDMTEIECNHQVSIERIANILKIRLCDIRFFHRNKINDGIYIVKVRW